MRLHTLVQVIALTFPNANAYYAAEQCCTIQYNLQPPLCSDTFLPHSNDPPFYTTFQSQSQSWPCNNVHGPDRCARVIISTTRRKRRTLAAFNDYARDHDRPENRRRWPEHNIG